MTDKHWFDESYHLVHHSTKFTSLEYFNDSRLKVHVVTLTLRNKGERHGACVAYNNRSHSLSYRRYFNGYGNGEQVYHHAPSGDTQYDYYRDAKQLTCRKYKKYGSLNLSTEQRKDIMKSLGLPWHTDVVVLKDFKW